MGKQDSPAALSHRLLHPGHDSNGLLSAPSEREGRSQQINGFSGQRCVKSPTPLWARAQHLGRDTGEILPQGQNNPAVLGPALQDYKKLGVLVVESGEPAMHRSYAVPNTHWKSTGSIPSTLEAAARREW